MTDQMQSIIETLAFINLVTLANFTSYPLNQNFHV